MTAPQQLARLRRTIARIERKYATAGPVRGIAAPCAIERWMPGELVRTRFGEHFETEKLWEPHRRHGNIGISDMWSLPEDLLDSLSQGEIARSHPGKWAFLDTETTGLAGPDTYAFLIGVGAIEAGGFRLRQFFLREEADERSALARMAEHLAQFDVLITFNGKAYDQPLLETRFRTLRMPNPFRRMEHLDLLFGARRLWKLRLESCRLMDLENRILGVEREGDLPGVMIPYCYFDYLRTQEAFRLVPIFHHNAIDILSLACLTAVVPLAFRSPEEAAFHHGSDVIGLARWILAAGRPEEALRLFRRAVDLGLPDGLLFRTLWDAASLEKKLGTPGALAAFAELTESRNPYRVRALEELAKHYERAERNYPLALEMTLRALELERAPRIERREERLRKRLARLAASMR